MTQIELRVKFKLDTGELPLWGEDCWPKTWRRKAEGYLSGKKKSSFGLWLEEQLGNSVELRREYEKNGTKAIHRQPRNINSEWLTSHYIDWLEEKMLAK